MHAETSTAAAQWLVAGMTTFGGRVGDIAPKGFEAYARVFHPPISGSWAELASANGRVMHPAVQWARIVGDTREQARWGSLGGEAAGALAGVLGGHTATPDDCTFAIWEGWGGIQVDRTAAMLVLPQRNYWLYGGTVAEAAHSFDRFPDRQANLWWPADHAWLVASEIDFDSTIVAGSRALVDAVLASALEALEVTVDTDLSSLGDRLNV